MAGPTQANKAFANLPHDRPQTGAGLFPAFSFAQFQFCAIIIILAASGLVPFKDILCVLLASIYICIMSRFAFPPVTAECPPSIYRGSKVLQVYIIFAAFVGLYLPLAYILLGVSMGYKQVVQSAAPHTFFLACQVVSEQITSTSHAVSLPARALVPILYNSGRLVSIWSWIQADFSKGVHDVSAPLEQVSVVGIWVFIGRAFAIANMLLWSYNLFCFLLPMYLPRCFRKYFEDEKTWATLSKKDH